MLLYSLFLHPQQNTFNLIHTLKEKKTMQNYSHGYDSALGIKPCSPPSSLSPTQATPTLTHCISL